MPAFDKVDNRVTAHAHVGHVIAHHLQMGLLRSHLRLSIADLHNRKIQIRFDQAKKFASSSTRTLLGPLNLVQDLTSIAAQSWTLRSVLSEKGRRARLLIGVNLFNPLFEIFYNRHENYGTRNIDSH
jgi:hypothetical protein